ncbi:MAG: hypothetical protein ACRCT2_16275 [Plesiomonas shigelloides]
MRDFQYSPSHAGGVLLKRAALDRRNLNRINRAAIKASGLSGDALFEAMCYETARIRKLDHKEVAAELAAK